MLDCKLLVNMTTQQSSVYLLEDAALVFGRSSFSEWSSLILSKNIRAHAAFQHDEISFDILTLRTCLKQMMSLVSINCWMVVTGSRTRELSSPSKKPLWQQPRMNLEKSSKNVYHLHSSQRILYIQHIKTCWWSHITRVMGDQYRNITIYVIS